MLKFLKELIVGFRSGFRWYGRRVQESRWYVIPLVIDVIFIPVKLIVFGIMAFTKKGRRWLINTFEEMMED